MREYAEQLKYTIWGDLYSEDPFRTREQFFGAHDPTTMELFMYTRLRQSVKAATPTYPLEPPTLLPLQALLQSSPPNVSLPFCANTFRP